jgi:hypothetical protein
MEVIKCWARSELAQWLLAIVVVMSFILISGPDRRPPSGPITVDTPCGSVGCDDGPGD